MTRTQRLLGFLACLSTTLGLILHPLILVKMGLELPPAIFTSWAIEGIGTIFTALCIIALSPSETKAIVAWLMFTLILFILHLDFIPYIILTKIL